MPGENFFNQKKDKGGGHEIHLFIIRDGLNERGNSTGSWWRSSLDVSLSPSICIALDCGQFRENLV
jgi:hypothetical protein